MAGIVDRNKVAATKAQLEKRFGVVDQSDGPDPWDEEDLWPKDIDKLAPRISLNLGITLNAGNYRSVHADAGLTIDRPAGLTTDQTFTWLEGVLMDKVEHALDQLLGAIE